MTLLSAGVAADRGVRMRHVRNGGQHQAQVFLDLLDLRFQAGDLLAQTSAFRDELLLLVLVLFLRDQLGDFVLALLQDLRFLKQILALIVEHDDAIHVGRDGAILAIGFDGVEVVANELGVEHYGLCSSGVYATFCLPT